jgi:2'-hydroxyisoflavone reductase
VLCPDTKDQPVQLIDMTDLAEWMAKMIAKKATGIYNAVGPYKPVRFGDLVARWCALFDGIADPVWAPVSFLQASELPFGGLPFWLSGNIERYSHFQINADKARKTGLSHRPLEDSFRSTYDWDSHRSDIDLTTGLTHDRELELLEQLQSE